MIPRFSGLFTLLVLLLSMPGAVAGAATDYAPVIEEVRAELIRQMRGERVPGAAIALVDGQEVVWAQGFGKVASDQDTLVGSHTPFAAGEFAKLVTTVAILQQVSAGRMDLDAPLTAYLPGLTIDSRFPDAAAPTLRQLLTHHGGVPNNDFGGSYRREPVQRTPPVTRTYLAQRPGTIYGYSNLGYVLLGQALEAVAGQPFVQYAADRVLEPLAMSDASFIPPEDRARAHDERGRVARPVFVRDLPAAGLYASVRDMARMARWFLSDDTRPVLDRAWVEEMGQVQNAEVALDLDNLTGLGWQLTNTGRHRVERLLRLNSFLSHSTAVLLLAPDEQLAVVLMANSMNAGELVREVGGLALDAALEARHGRARPEPWEGLPPSVGLAPVAEPAPLRDRYNTALGEMSFLSNGGDEREMGFVGRLFGLEPRPDGWYEISFKLFGVIDLRFSILAEILLRPVRISGEEVLLTHYRGRTFLLGTALPDGGYWPGVEDWVGRYRLSNPGVLSELFEIDEVELAVADRRLYVSYELRNIIRLEPRVPALHLSNGRFYVPGLGTNMGDEFDLLEVDGQRMMRFSNWVFVQQ